MKQYKYPFFIKLAYRFANIPITLILLIYLIEAFTQISQHWYWSIFILINIGIIFVLNKYYLHTYYFFPSTIYADNEKLICQDFLLNNRVVEIKHLEIKKISGGIFSGTTYRPINLYDSQGNVMLGFYAHNKEFRMLLETILRNVPEDLYQELLKRIKNIA